MAGYDPSAANEYNQLIQQGLDPADAAQLAGIAPEDLGNYSVVNGLLTENEGPPTQDTDVGPQTDYGTTYDEFGTVVPIAPPTQDTPVNPASDPSQFPAYDDEGNLQPGFAINEETGQTFFRGVSPPIRQTAGFDPNFDEFGNLDAAIAAQQAPGFDPNFDEFAGLDAAIAAQQNATPINNPYYGLTSEQIQQLGGADPTDPYIRARLGIPQLPGSTLAATPGFGTIKTGIPLIDSALGFLGGLFGGSSTATPPTPAAPAVAPQSDPSQFPAYDDEGNLQPGFAINEETGQTYYKGLGPPTSNSTQTLTDAETAALFDGEPNFVTSAERATQDAQTAADAADLYPGTNNTNLRNINEASAAIAANEAGIARAEEIIAQNNAELADPFISDERRAELEANNAQQLDYIQVATENTAINQNVIEQNADAFAAGGGEPNSGQAAPEVAAFEDPGIEPVAAEEIGPLDNTTTLSEEETANLFESESYAPVEATDVTPPTETPRLLTDEELDAIYPPTDPKEIGAIFGTRIISDEARAAMSDPEAIKAQLAANAAPPPPDIISETVPLSEEETAALFAEQEASAVEVAEADVVPLTPEEEAALFAEEEASAVEVAEADVVPLTPEEEAALFAEEEASTVETADAEAVPLSEEETAALFAEAEASTVEAEDPFALDPNEDEALQLPPGAEDENVESEEAFALNPDEDEALQTPPGAEDDDPPTEEPFALNPDEDEALQTPPGAEDDDPPTEEPFALNPDEDEAIANQQGGDDEGADPLGDAETVEANNLAAMKIRAQSQATLQSRFKTPGDQDWRVRIQLSPNSDYLYNDSDPGILAPLRATNGVLFPYVPQITTAYQANYEQYDLTHSNYRGIFYKNSRVNDIQIRGTFTAQDTKEAEYLLAVIHFFRSVTKMFYGQDWQRGTPPPMVFLSGFGNFQFNGHPCVVNTFNYTLPNDVDYIRATNFNNYGTNLFNRRTAPQSSPGGINAAGAVRLANALLPKGALPKIPAAGPVNGTVTNTQSSTYVPTKLEIDLTLIPVQTRSQVSKQFSMQEFANGNLIRGGFW